MQGSKRRSNSLLFARLSAISGAAALLRNSLQVVILLKAKSFIWLSAHRRRAKLLGSVVDRGIRRLVLK
jgi:hypothetical protein